MSFLLVLKAGNKNYASFWNFLWTMSAVIWLFFDHNLVFSRALDTRFICRRKIAKVCVLSVCVFQKRHEFHNTYHVVTPYNILNGLGVSLKWPGKIILSWLNIDTSSPHVLTTYFFEVPRILSLVTGFQLLTIVISSFAVDDTKFLDPPLHWKFLRHLHIF